MATTLSDGIYKKFSLSYLAGLTAQFFTHTRP